MLAVIILGSPVDRDLGAQIAEGLEAFGIPVVMRTASAHKTPHHLLNMLEQYEADGRRKVYITVAGRSNALSGMVDAAVGAPVVACPPYADKFGGGDILSSLRTPSGVAPAVVLEPANAALLAAKILGLVDADLRQRVLDSQAQQRQRLIESDAGFLGEERHRYG
jgi:phosphoribosylaminoimidazole carboxylase PurE protein